MLIGQRKQRAFIMSKLVKCHGTPKPIPDFETLLGNGVPINQDKQNDCGGSAYRNTSLFVSKYILHTLFRSVVARFLSR